MLLVLLNFVVDLVDLVVWWIELFVGSRCLVAGSCGWLDESDAFFCLMGKDVAWLVLTLCKRLRIAVTTSLCLLVQLKPNWFWVLSGFPAELLRFLQISRMAFL